MTPPFLARTHLRGHRRPGPSPFGATAPSIAAALVYGAASLVWVATGGNLPGGRWLAVHLFTLGSLTNLVLVFSEHFGRTLTRSPDERVRWQAPVLNAGVLLVLVGMATGTRSAVGVGATVTAVAVMASYRRLRRLRRRAVGARFVWVVRTYERAHGAFVHGAILGLLMGVGALPGAWYGAARLAHLHINVLGWGGLTVLATLVFFGPTIVRTRIVAGADARAARALRLGATGLTVGVLLLLLTGAGGTVATVSRALAAAAFALFAWATTATCRPVVTAARRANPSATRWSVVAVGAWFPIVVWADVAVVGFGAWRRLDLVGLTMLLGVLVQTIATVLTYLAPMLRSRSFSGRNLLLARLERGADVRTAAYNVGVVAVVGAAAAGGAAGAALAGAGWALLAGALGIVLVAALRPLPPAADDLDRAPSSVTRRHRPTSESDDA